VKGRPGLERFNAAPDLALLPVMMAGFFGKLTGLCRL
jgi:hypothetical protein